MDQKLRVVIDAPCNASDRQTPWPDVKRSRLSLVMGNCQIGYFRISLSLCMQTLLWKTLVSSIPNGHFPFKLLQKLPSTALTLLWSLALFSLLLTSLIYTFKCLLYFEKVKEEFLHHVGANYFFAPWISSLLLLQANPFTIPANDFYYKIACWWVFVVPIIILDIKIYGQWFTKGKRFLSKVANPASQMSVIANLVAAKASMEMEQKEAALCFFSLGMVHYLVLFVTLYQRLPGGDCFPVKLRPVFSLFIATPSMASLAWRSINGSFDSVAKMLFFLSLFFSLSLAIRPRLFKKSMKKFSAAWWSYSFSSTLLALVAFEYAEEVKEVAAHVLMLTLSVVSVGVLFVLLVLTVMNAKEMFMGNTVDQDQTSDRSNTSTLNI